MYPLTNTPALHGQLNQGRCLLAIRIGQSQHGVFCINQQSACSEVKVKYTKF